MRGKTLLKIAVNVFFFLCMSAITMKNGANTIYV